MDKILDWALTIGRFLIILTETIALIIFVSRFSLDRELVDLHDNIKRKQQLLQSLNKTEGNFRSLQARLAIAKKLEGSSGNLASLLKEILSASQSNGVITAFTMSERTILINSNVKSTSAITTLVNAIKNNPRIASVSLDKIENKTANAFIAISITATLKEGKK